MGGCRDVLRGEGTGGTGAHVISDCDTHIHSPRTLLGLVQQAARVADVGGQAAGVGRIQVAQLPHQARLVAVALPRGRPGRKQVALPLAHQRRRQRGVL